MCDSCNPGKVLEMTRTFSGGGEAVMHPFSFPLWQICLIFFKICTSADSCLAASQLLGDTVRLLVYRGCSHTCCLFDLFTVVVCIAVQCVCLVWPSHRIMEKIKRQMKMHLLCYHLKWPLSSERSWFTVSWNQSILGCHHCRATIVVLGT